MKSGVKNLGGKSCLSVALLIVVAGFLSSCQETINYPAPTIATISPSSVNAGQSSFNLTVTGSNLTPASTVNWGAEPLATLFQNVNSLSATVPSTLIDNPGMVNITITTPSPGGGTTTDLIFTINPTTSAVPRISSISPTSVMANGGAFTLDVTGTNFVTLSNVIVNGTVMPTSFESSTALEVSSVPGSFANSAGLLQVVVVSPPPGGGSSNTVTLTVANPVPTIASISPTNNQAGAGAGTLTVTGSNFAINAEILFNGSARPDTVKSATSLTAQLTAADFLEGGVEQIQVVNPAPGGGASNIVPLAVTPTDTAGLPVLVDLAPTGAQANSGVCGGPANCASGAQGLTLTMFRPFGRYDRRICGIRFHLRQSAHATDEFREPDLPAGYLPRRGHVQSDYLSGGHFSERRDAERAQFRALFG